jgi:hypothetical protein
MSDERPFLPRNKPKFWVIGLLSGFIGLACGLVAFGAALLNLSAIRMLFSILMAVSVLVFFICWFGCAFGAVTGRYRNLQPKPWNEQVC